MIGIYTNLYQLTARPEYREAAATFIEHTVPDMFYHTRGMSSIGLLLHYRQVTDDDFVDDRVKTWMYMTRDRVDTLQYITESTDADRKYDWLHGCETHSSAVPTAFNMANLMTGEARYLDRAVEMALDHVRAIYAEEFRPSTRMKAPGDWNWFNYIMA